MSDTQVVQFDKLNDTNYHTWAIMMEAVLIQGGLWTDLVQILEEDTDKYDVKKTARDATKLAQARASMILRVEPSQLSHMSHRDPMEVWRNLQKVHQARGFATNLALRRKFLTAKKGSGQTMQSWIGDIQTQVFIMEQAGIIISDTDKILALTMGLPPSFSPVIINFDATPDDQLTFDHVIVRLLNEETRQASTVATTTESESMPADGSYHPESAFAASARRALAGITCYNCQKKGHYQSDCPDKKDSKSATAASAYTDADDIW